MLGLQGANRKESLFQGCIDNKKIRKNGNHILNNSNHIPSKGNCFNILNVFISVYSRFVFLSIIIVLNKSIG